MAAERQLLAAYFEKGEKNTKGASAGREAGGHRGSPKQVKAGSHHRRLHKLPATKSKRRKMEEKGGRERQEESGRSWSEGVVTVGKQDERGSRKKGCVTRMIEY